MTLELPITLIFRRRIDEGAAPIIIMQVTMPDDGSEVQGWGETVQEAWEQLGKEMDAKMHELGWIGER